MTEKQHPILNFAFSLKMKNSEFWYEYNIPGEKRDFYAKIKDLEYGTKKEREIYYQIEQRFANLNTWHDLVNVREELSNDLWNAYPKDKIIEILEKISNDNELSNDEKELYKEFFKGIDYIYRHHNSATFIEPQEPYFYAIARLDSFNKMYGSYATYPNIYNFLAKMNTKMLQRDISIEER